MKSALGTNTGIARSLALIKLSFSRGGETSAADKEESVKIRNLWQILPFALS